MSPRVRDPVVAGMFYPEDPAELKAMVEGFLDVEVEQPPGRIISIVSPHAGFIYSGGIAAHGYRLLQDVVFDTAVILAPSHRELFSGVNIYGGDAYSTPLGIVPVNAELSRRISSASSSVQISDVGHGNEHSLEVQLPFLQALRGENFDLVPMIVGEISKATADDIAAGIADAIGGINAIIVASTDLSHYHTHERAKSIDGIMSQMFSEFDADALFDACTMGECEACGINPLAITMKASGKLGALHAYVLNYATSGDITGDYSGVVGYMSGVITD